MQTFRVLVHGEGMVVRRWLVLRRTVGFYATRLVEAESDAAAGDRALSELRGDPRLALAAIRAPALAVEEVEVVDGPPATWPEPGIVFYPAGAGAGAT